MRMKDGETGETERERERERRKTEERERERDEEEGEENDESLEKFSRIPKPFFPSLFIDFEK